MREKPLPTCYDSDDLSDIGWFEIGVFAVLSLAWLATMGLVAGILLWPAVRGLL